MKSKIFNFETSLIESRNTSLFLGDQAINIQSYDAPKYPWIMSYAEELRAKGNWSKNELRLDKEKSDFDSLDKAGKHIFESGLQFAINLDSIAGRAPLQMFVQNGISNNPEWELFETLHQANEMLHSESYTEITKSIYGSSHDLLKDSLNNPFVLERAKSIMNIFNHNEMIYDKYQANQTSISYGKEMQYPEVTKEDYEDAIYMNLVNFNIFEGIRFFCTFSTNWSFSEQPLKKMLGSSGMFELIARDEMIHLAAFQKVLRTIRNDVNESLHQASKRCEHLVYELFKEVLLEEKEWIKYLFKYGTPLIGMNEQILTSYIEDYIFYIRVRNIGLDPEKIGLIKKSNPIPWINNYLDSSNKKSAPQEQDLTTYIAAVDSSKDAKISFDDL